MTTPALPASERFFAPEITKIYFLPTIADAGLAWTRTEADAGDDISGEVADISGWTVSGNMINTPDLGSRFNSQISGRTSADNSSITFYADKAGEDIRTVLQRGLRGFIVIMDGGDVAAQPSDVFPVEVTAVGKVRSVGDQAAQLTVTFAITAEPGEDIPVPAAA